MVELNAAQKDAVDIEDSVLVTAPPGSGKTRTLVAKAVHELKQVHDHRKFVVAITYTNKAADEVLDRIEAEGVDTGQLWVGTIHAFCLEWILRPYAKYHPRLRHGFRVADSQESEQILTLICSQYTIGPRVSYWDCGYFVTGQGAVELTNRKGNLNAKLKLIYADYFARLEELKAIDFEQILSSAWEILQEHPQISVTLSQIINWILVDEYQDTRRVQYSIIASIVSAGSGQTNTFLVGDPNQAIYGSLGGFAISPDDFSRMCGVPVVTRELMQNYRSTDRIIEYFSQFAVAPAVVSGSSLNFALPSTVTRNESVSRDGLSDHIAEQIVEALDNGVPATEICVLGPQWIQLAPLTRRLAAALPECEFDGPGMVPFARDVENFWYKVSKIALTNAAPDMYVRRLRWATDVIRELESSCAVAVGLSARDFLRLCNSLSISSCDGLEYLERYFRALASALGFVIEEIPYLKGHHETFLSSSKRRVARLTKDNEYFVTDLRAFQKVFRPRSGVTVSTIHGVKGLEFDTVIVCGLLEGMVPNFNDAVGVKDVNARKLLYVASSRARRRLHMISETGRRNGRGDLYHPTDVLDRLMITYD